MASSSVLIYTFPSCDPNLLTAIWERGICTTSYRPVWTPCAVLISLTLQLQLPDAFSASELCLGHAAWPVPRPQSFAAHHAKDFPWSVYSMW